MSWGPGRVQREALAYLRSLPSTRKGETVIAPVWLIADVVYGHVPTSTLPPVGIEKCRKQPANSTVAQRTAVRRAMQRLVKDGLVEDWWNGECPQRSFYRAAPRQ